LVEVCPDRSGQTSTNSAGAGTQTDPAGPDGTRATQRATMGRMRAVIQRASRASVAVDGEIVGAIDKPGLVVLVGATHSDSAANAEKLAAKVWGLRILRDEQSCADVGAPLLVVSQFTVYADTRKGRRPSWSAAAPGEVAEPLVDHFCATLRELGAAVETGRFGAHMDVELVNDGPVTLILEA
jgi:D-aminoacyl-tRNA deacylase